MLTQIEVTQRYSVKFPVILNSRKIRSAILDLCAYKSTDRAIWKDDPQGIKGAWKGNGKPDGK
jgi:hypothetical protein